MAFSTNGGGYNSRRRGGNAPLAEINVTPFVDVVLVLLIIFMLTAHVMEFGLEVDVPKVRPSKDTAQELPVVTVTKTGDVYLNGKMLNVNDMGTTIRTRFGGKTKGIYIMADKQAIWDSLAQVVAELGAAGFQVNMVTQPLDSTGKGQK